MRYLPKTSQLKIFQSIIKYGSFRSAAKALNQTQPTLTRSINELERLLGTSLIVRGSGGLTLTKAGELLESRVEFMLNDLECMVNAIEHMNHSSRGKVAIGGPTLSFFSILPSAIKIFRKKFPHINVNLIEDDTINLLSGLRSGKLDFIIGASSNEFSAKEFIDIPLFTTQMCMIARRGHPLEHATSITELMDASWYLPRITPSWDKEIEKVLFLDSLEKNTIIRGSSLAAGFQMILNADFLAIAPKKILDISYFKDSFCTLEIEKILPDITYSFIYSQRLPLTTVAKSFMRDIEKFCYIHYL